MKIVPSCDPDVQCCEYTNDDFVQRTEPWAIGTPSELSEFDKELHKRWDAAMDAGAFRYGIGHILTRIIPGPKGYVGQLNTLRAIERRKPQEISSVSQPFNPDKFNFTWIKSKEIIFDLRNVTDQGSNKTAENGEGAKTSDDCESRKMSTHRLIINVSPMEYGHCLLVPQIYQQNPQVLTYTALKMAVETLLLCGHRGARLGFNSLFALSSVNHLHFHMYYFTHEALVDSCTVDHLSGPYYEFTALPCPGFAMQLHGTTVEELARAAHKVSNYLYESDVAHNLFMCRGTVFGEKRESSNTTIRLFIWPRKKFIGNKSSEEFNVACIELAGHLPIKEENGYQNLTEADVDKIIETALLPSEHYEQIKAAVVRMGKDFESS